MKRGYLNLMRLSKIFFVVLLVNSTSTVFGYYPLSWDDLMYQMEKNMSWQVAKMETMVQIFDPFLKNLKKETPHRPIELPARRFNQIIHWKDGEILAVESNDLRGDLLHFYYENKSDLLSISLSDNRTFTSEDIIPKQLRFKSRFERIRSKALEEFGIFSKNVSYHIKEDNYVFLCIGDVESGHFALIDSKTYELYSLHSKIWKNDGRWHDLKIIFKKYEKYRWQTYPVITEYYLDKQLFKRVTVNKIRTLSKLPIKSLHKKALNLRRPKYSSLKNDYAL